MRYLPLFPLLLLPFLPSCASLPEPGPMVSITGTPQGGFRASVRREVAVGVVDPSLLEQGCRRDVLRVALEEAQRRSWGVPQVDDRLTESFSGRIPTPVTFCTAALVVHRPT